MGTALKIGKNVFFLAAGNIIQKILSFVMVVFIAQKIGVEAFGVYSFAFSFVILFLAFADFGIATLIFREIAKKRHNASELMGNAIVVRIALFFITLFGVFALILFLHFFRPSQYTLQVIFFVLIAAVSLLLDSMAGLFRMSFFAFQEMQYDFFVNTFYKIVLVFLTLSVLFFGYGLTEIFYVALFSSFVNFVISFFVMVKKFFVPKFSFNLQKYRELAVAGLPFCFIAFFLSIYASIDLTMLSIFKGNLSVGYYSAAMRLISAISFIPIVLTSSIFPVLASFYGSLNRSVGLIILKSLKYLLIIILPIAFATTLLSERIISLIYPVTQANNFLPASGALAILIWFIVLGFLNLVFLNSFQSTAFEKKAFYIVVFSLVVNVVLNLVLIPLYDFNGAAFASVLSELAFFVLAVFFSAKHFEFFNAFSAVKLFFKPLIASLFIFVFIYLFFFLNIFVLFFVSAVMYFLVLFFIRGFDLQDISFFRQLINMKK